MKLGEGNEILVRGPNIFAGYWNRPARNGEVLFCEGWFRTGDQGEQTALGNWRIIGRLKNLLVLNSGHNVAPEPLEEKLRPVPSRSATGRAVWKWAELSGGVVDGRSARRKAQKRRSRC